MFKAIQKSGWLAGSLILMMPVMLIFFLASQMAYSQVQGRFADYQNIPEVTQATDLTTLVEGETVLVRGTISAATCNLTSPSACDRYPAADGLVVFQERPAAGRDIRFREEFGQIFPYFVVDLTDAQITVVPASASEYIIRGEPQSVLDGDRELTGFKVGDAVLLQGEWQPGIEPTLIGVTGITGGDKQSLMAEFAGAFQIVYWARNIFGLLAGAGIILLIAQRRRARRKQSQEAEEWNLPETKTVHTT